MLRTLSVWTRGLNPLFEFSLRKVSYGDTCMLDIQPVLDKLQELSAQHGVWITPKLILYPTGDGAVILEDVLNHKQIAAVDFAHTDYIMSAVESLNVKAKQALSS
jgi:hypothetical protein